MHGCQNSSWLVQRTKSHTHTHTKKMEYTQSQRHTLFEFPHKLDPILYIPRCTVALGRYPDTMFSLTFNLPCNILKMAVVFVAKLATGVASPPRTCPNAQKFR